MKIPQEMAHPLASLLDRSRLRLLDHDITEIERLAGLDGKFPGGSAFIRALALDPIAEAVSRARDQDGKRDSPADVGSDAGLVIDRIDQIQIATVEPFDQVGQGVCRWGGGALSDNEGEHRRRSGPSIGLPAGSTMRARAEPHGSRRIVNGPIAADLLEITAMAPKLALGMEEVHGVRVVHVKSADFEMAVAACGVVVRTLPRSRAWARLHDDAAENPRSGDGLAVRCSDLSFHRDTRGARSGSPQYSRPPA